MHLCRTSLPRRLLICCSLAWALALALALPGLAQEATPSSEVSPGTSEEVPGDLTPAATLLPTATAIPTPTCTPTPTPTLTAVQARLMLAQAYLEGGDYARAAELFGTVALEERGNSEALAGLRAALAAAASATAAALTPTVPVATATPPPQAARFGETFASRWRDLAGTALPGLLVVILVYLLAQVARWALYWARELWLTRGLPLLGQRPVYPGYLLAEFTDATGIKDFQGAQIVKQSLTETLLSWNQLVQERQVPVEPAPGLELGGMAWIKVLWSWILPPPRGYKVSGVLMGSQPDNYQLSVTRVSLSTNSVDRSFTFSDQSLAEAPDRAFRELARRAARWLLQPLDMEVAEAGQLSLAKSTRRAAPSLEAEPLAADKIFDQALDLLLPLRRQVEQDAIDFVDARRRLDEADKLLALLPEGSGLRRDLQAVVSDLRRAVQGV